MRTDLKEGEEKILEVAKHWIVLIKPLLSTGLFLSIAIISYSYRTKLPVGVGNLFAFIALISAVYFLYRIFERRINIWAVTNLRVIDEYGVFSRNAKESPLEKVNNVSYQQSLMGRIFGYGSVQIQTAAEMGATTYRFVSSPRLLKDTITLCQNEYSQTQIALQAQTLAQAITGTQKPGADTRECPYCAEIIKAKAKICRFCQRELEDK